MWGAQRSAVRSIAWLDAWRRWEVPYEKKKPCNEANIPDEHAPTQESVQRLGCWIRSDPRWGVERPTECTPLKGYAAAEPGAFRGIKQETTWPSILLPCVAVE